MKRERHQEGVVALIWLTEMNSAIDLMVCVSAYILMCVVVVVVFVGAGAARSSREEI